MGDTKKSKVRPLVHARPPVVAVLGHVDHGKTTLLDTIRKTNVVAGEHGGITQKIGAYQIKLKTQNSKLKTEEQFITFIDTPGHEAFAAMRARGAAAADIVILVVAADDSVKPQTVESIEQIKAAGIPMIVAVNKIDLPGANVDRVKQDLARAGVQVEGFGGQVPLLAISAKQGTGIAELLDLILLLGQMKELAADPKAPPAAIVVETMIDKGKGMVAVVIVKSGTLVSGSPLYDGVTHIGRVRAMFDEHGVAVPAAVPSKPVEVLGFSHLPTIGSILTTQPVEVTPQAAQTVTKTPISAPVDSIPDFLKPVAQQKEQKLTILLKADSMGSIEAILASLGDEVTIVESSIGDITEADVLLAKSSTSFVVGFNVKCTPSATKLAQTEKVIWRTYTIIYELIRELKEAVSGMKEVLIRERELGRGTIIAEFPFEKQRIAGTKILSGRLARGDTVRVLRKVEDQEKEIGMAKIKSIRRGKEASTKVEVGSDCGVLLDPAVDFAINDGIIAITTG
ncbi:translation initiation factor IF-2 [Candidatus Gottesmanbacteria bacterium RIFCSPLOWO2_01_FULL_49_10]|uniref:Translation initiation factor IF-2 n=1 Tax=Candidatus Gottesmanbacteria bacterium RIFCSPLOWO2_01_FULL_49_10 TaxID=1798396 RepID=A0A1F6B1F3_9BACT|nr:MAG: translation initiation factor IF-2 [Candidatus Gottesmanbacteria bacterium RIFCSPLOWO2_01_FULL_49_10]